jgi:hypothetical protein
LGKFPKPYILGEIWICPATCGYLASFETSCQQKLSDWFFHALTGIALPWIALHCSDGSVQWRRLKPVLTKYFLPGRLLSSRQEDLTGQYREDTEKVKNEH